MRAALIIAIGCTAFAGGVRASDVSLTSGHAVELIEVIHEDAPIVSRFRFLNEGIASQGLSFEDIEPDLHELCERYALPRLAEEQRLPEQVVISISDRILPFGEISPDATQYFDAFTIEGARCMWEQF